MNKDDWAGVVIPDGTSLIVGWRSGQTLTARRIELGRDMAGELRERARATLLRIADREPRAYEATGVLEPEQAFLFTVEDLPERQRPQRARPGESAGDGQDKRANASAMLRILNEPGGLKSVARSDVEGRSFLFYAVIFGEGTLSAISFIKKHNAASVAKGSPLLGQLGQTLTKLEDDVLVFARDFDVVRRGSDLVSLREGAIQSLFADVNVLGAAAPLLVKDLQGFKLKFASVALKALEEACSKQRLLARHLQELLESPHIVTLTIKQVEDYLASTKQAKGAFIAGGKLTATPDTVPALLEILAQRRYRGGYDDVLRRAERSSVVQAPAPAAPATSRARKAPLSKAVALQQRGSL